MMQPSEFDALKLEIEKLRLALDNAKHQNDLTRTYLERWRTDVQPVHEHRLKSRDQAYGFIKMAVQSVFLLNGGALIAFPTFAKLTDATLRDHLPQSLKGIGCFVAGLILTAMAMLLAAFAYGLDTDALERKEKAVKAGVNLQHSSPDRRADLEKVRDAAEAERARLGKHAIRTGYIAIALAALALTVFIGGAYFAARVLQ